METTFLRSRLIRLTALVAICGLVNGRAVRGQAEAGMNGEPRKKIAAEMRAGYLALVRDSIVPADARIVGTAALIAIGTEASDRVVPLPADFGGDFERDAAWLGLQVADLSSPWRVLDAMARAADTAHTSFGTIARRRAITALLSGHPEVSPGFNVYSLPDGQLVVFDVIKGASADLSGLCAGDILWKVNGERARCVDPFMLVTLPVGSVANLEIERAGQRKVVAVRLNRSEVAPVDSRLMSGEVGYIFVRWFARSSNPEHDTAALIRRAVKGFVGKGAVGLILDLRSALGGSGEVNIASALCDGDVIYILKQPLSAPENPIKRDGARIWSGRPMAVLLNENTVSAGEDLALTLRELGHATILGQTSRGGLTEFSSVPLGDGYGMMVPTGLVLGPLTRADQPGHAVHPDRLVANPTVAELLGGHDAQLGAAQALLKVAVN